MSDAPCPRTDCTGTLTVLSQEEVEALPPEEDELDLAQTYARCSMCGSMFTSAQGEEVVWETVELE